GKSRPTKGRFAAGLKGWLSPEQGAGADAGGSREFGGAHLLAVLVAQPQHLDLAALRRHPDRVLVDGGNLAHLADHVREAAEHDLAGIVDVELLARKRGPGARRRVAAADEVVDLFYGLRPVD